jgi:uncharacterized protein
MPTNALFAEKSPYLRQHAENPVDWLPWGPKAFEKARAEQKPIFLSIGYSTCHWCHVMAHESFENESVAEILNRDFVSIKLDREERPDVDRIYMLFVQASTGSGGWPMSVWLTPELKPFFGGTYFPPDSRYGRPGFKEVLHYLAKAWREDRERIETSSQQVTEQLRDLVQTKKTEAQPGRELFESGFAPLRRTYDAHWGGFGTAPKFPRPSVFLYLLHYYAATKNEEALEMVVHTLRQMAAGGMNDQLGGGFHRYSVDERWFVPHFEKMLYDQAQLAIAYLEAYQLTQDETLAQTARDIFEYVLRDMRDDTGAFYSAEDADSQDPENPGHAGEGAFYIWSSGELARVLGPEDARVFALRYGVQEDGNVMQDPHGEFTGRNILYRATDLAEIAARTGNSPAQVEQSLAKSVERLMQVRSTRPRPHLDRKLLTSWNALMISAFMKGFSVLGDERYQEAALKALDFLRTTLYDAKTTQLLRRYCDGEAAIQAFLDDYAFLAQSMLDVFAINSDAALLEAAIEIANTGLSKFEDVERGGYYSAREAPDLLMSIKEDYDGAEPSGNSIATDVLIRISQLCDDKELGERASRSLEAAAEKLKSQPTAAPWMLSALGRWLAGPQHVVIRCECIDSVVIDKMRGEWKKFEPTVATLVVDDQSARQLSELIPFLKSLERTGKLTIYRCTNYACTLPESFD